MFISIVGTIGLVGIIGNDLDNASLTENAAKLTNFSDNVIPKFLYYFLNSSLGQNQITALTVGTTQLKLALKRVAMIEIPLPPLPTQERIADILGTLDDKIELNRQMNRTLEAIARAIFKSWFVDFDPVYAKMEGRDYPLTAEVMALFPDELVESELGLIPKGWEVKDLSDFGKVVTGKTPSTKNPDYYASNDVPFLKIPDMHNQFFITETNNYLSQAGADSQKNKYIPPKSICVSCIATPGLVAMPTQPVQTNQQINSVIPRSELFSNFLLLALKRKGDEIRLRGSGGSVLRNLNKTEFSRIQIIMPYNDMLDLFNELVSLLFDKMIINQKQNNICSEMRDALLVKFMNGEILGD